ncbi:MULTISPECIES: DUF4365 domain-containing protein [Halomonadaceae]|uniref:DUF4365 domain-containing protein n=1 Tax=Halomonadaceae TaxID=28256 RepID=UPI0015829B33|nr:MULTISPECIES: DUF4365 domain-containing protein [Halomonas]MDI4636690.1 DUF4365 domain-containing protein [Halomonas sp. BMC7]NUJ61055.1 DUF4365 domain-containing protein [Halomonas taeanensis]
MNVLEFDQGNAGESMAASALSLIFNGETARETMRGEGMGALDLQLKYSTDFPSPSYTQVAVQVKTGPSFGRWTPTKNRWRLQNIDQAHLKKWKATNQPVILIWVRLDPEIKIYWKLVDKKTPVETLSVSENHLLTPASRFEIERLLNKQRLPITRAGSFTVPSVTTTTEARHWARTKFKKTKGEINCCLGKVAITNYAWRHLTRVTRAQSHIRDSLIALPHAKELLSKTPHQIQTLPDAVELVGEKITVNRKVLAVYRNVHFSDKGDCVVYIRLDEKVIYNKCWRKKGLIRQKLCQQLRLESIYRKTAKR